MALWRLLGIASVVERRYLISARSGHPIDRGHYRVSIFLGHRRSDRSEVVGADNLKLSVRLGTLRRKDHALPSSRELL